MPSTSKIHLLLWLLLLTACSAPAAPTGMVTASPLADAAPMVASPLVAAKDTATPQSLAAPTYTYRVVKTYPHDPPGLYSTGCQIGIMCDPLRDRHLTKRHLASLHRDERTESDPSEKTRNFTPEAQRISRLRQSIDFPPCSPCLCGEMAFESFTTCLKRPGISPRRVSTQPTLPQVTGRVRFQPRRAI